MRRAWVGSLAVLAIAALGAAGLIVTRPSSDTAGPTRVIVTVDGVRTTLRAARATPTYALKAASVAPVDGALRAVVSGSVLDSLYEPGVVLVNGLPASMDARLEPGDRVTLRNGVDTVEPTAVREAAIPYPDQDKVGSGAWAAGREGLAEETYGVVSGEVTARRVLREPVAARELARAPTVSAGSSVFLTFDDGPDPSYTSQVLDVLKAQGVKATFCIVGRYAQAFPDVVRRIVAEGHTVCNHTQNHARLDSLSGAAIESEITVGADSITAAAGVRPRVLRLPYGRSNSIVYATAARLGWPVLGWTVDPSDYTRPGTEVIITRVVSAARPGSIVLFHDGGGDRSQTAAALPAIIGALRTAGYSFGTP